MSSQGPRSEIGTRQTECSRQALSALLCPTQELRRSQMPLGDHLERSKFTGGGVSSLLAEVPSGTECRPCSDKY